MTDKKEFDQNDLNVAFEQLKQNENLVPSSELDALILNMAAEELTAGGAEEKSNVTDISDISFRRGQRENHKALKKKGMFPNWVMPIGLAATVLLSFGVVNRVLMSPEFDSLTKQSSYEVMSDEVVVGTDSESKARAKKDDASFNKLVQPEIVQAKRLKSDNAKATVTVNGNEMNADISFAEKPPSAPADSPPSPALDIVTAQSATPVEGARYNDRDLGRVQASSSELESDKKSDKEQLLMDSRQEQHALMAKEKRERLTQARRSDIAAMQAEAVSAPVVVSAPQVDSAGASIGSIDSVEEVVVAGAIRDGNYTETSAADFELQAKAVSSLGEAESVDELVIAGNRAKNDNDTSGYAMIVGADRADMPAESAEAKSQVLQSILFEHKQCQVKQDCALVALACDSCDCLDAVNLENYSMYTSEFTQAEIAEQCFETTAVCVRNYCQMKEAE